MKIINIQGTNGSGKTTTAKSIIKHYDLFEEEMKTGSGNVKIQTNKSHSIIVIGSYGDENCGGCDKIKSIDTVINSIIYAKRSYKPDLIIYEGLLLSGNIKQSLRASQVAKMMKSDFEIIWLDRDAAKCVNSIYERNGGKQINERSVVDRHIKVERAMETLAKAGIIVKRYDTDSFSKDDLYKVIE